MDGTPAVCAKMLASVPPSWPKPMSVNMRLQTRSGSVGSFNVSKKTFTLLGNADMIAFKPNEIETMVSLRKQGAAILSPSTDITGEVGPMKVMPSGFRRSGSLGFSEACPQPGHTASTPFVHQTKPFINNSNAEMHTSWLSARKKPRKIVII